MMYSENGENVQAAFTYSIDYTLNAWCI